MREVTSSENKQNINVRSTNKSGVNGVLYNTKRNLWESKININKKVKFLGRFDNFDDAVMARYRAERDNNWSNIDKTSSELYLINNKLL